MTFFSRHIKLIESICETYACDEIAAKIAEGDHEGFEPYWKLIADPRILSDHNAMSHIALKVADGYLSGAHPTWELKIVDTPENEEVEPELDEDVIDVVHAHMVVPVAETHGVGQGWYEVSDEHATEWVIEDKNGDVVTSCTSREDADALAQSLNQGMAPHDLHGDIPVGTHIEAEHELVEDDEELDTGSNRFDKQPDYVVIINAIHERGERQQQALDELHARGLWLSHQQKIQAGLIDA